MKQLPALLKSFTPALQGVLLLLLTFFSSPVEAQEDSITVRIKGMRCEECAHNVMVAVKKLPGIESVRSNIERRTTTIVFDRMQTSADSIKARLAATGRYKASPYSPNDTIRRGFGLRMDDMHSQRCADRIMAKLQPMEGIDSLAPHLDKHYYFIRYDANRTCKAAIKEALVALGFTPVNYYSGNKVSYAYYLVPAEQATQQTVDDVLILDGVEDVCVNPKKHTLAVTFFTDETNAERLLDEIHNAGIKAQVPDIASPILKGWDGAAALPLSKKVVKNFKSVLTKAPEKNLQGWHLEPQANGTLLMLNDSRNAGINLGAGDYSFFVVENGNVEGKNNVHFTVSNLLQTIKMFQRTFCC